MIKFGLRRLLLGLLSAFAVTLVVFTLAQFAGDPVSIMMAGADTTTADLERLRSQLGYSGSPVDRYWHFLSGALRGDLGLSLRYRQPVGNLVAQRIGPTAELATAAIITAVVVGLPLGILAATRPRGKSDRAIVVFTMLGQSVPLFWLGIVSIQVLVVRLGLLPVGGRGGGDVHYLILPALTLATFPMSRITRVARASMLEVLSQEYMLTAPSKGLRPRTIIFVHAFRNALLPVITIIGLQTGTLFGGAVVTETVFGWPGLGQLSIQAALARDLPLLEAVVLLASFTFITVNLVVDLLYSVLDPRIRLT